MPIRLSILVSQIFLAACNPVGETVYLRQQIDPSLLEPCPISERRAETVRDLAILATEHLTSAQCANGKIAAIAETVGPQ